MTRYRARVSGPLLDRLDLHVEVPAVPFASLTEGDRGDPTADVRARVAGARARQVERFAACPGVYANAQMEVGLLRRFVRPPTNVVGLLQEAVERGLSARAYHRVLKVARTLADLDGRDEVSREDALEALHYRALDRRTP